MGKRLADSEWIILKALWGNKPQTLRSIISNVHENQPDVNWSYKTYHSYLRTMCEKKLVSCEIKNARDNYYSPLITREEALEAEGDSLLTRISSNSVGELVVMLSESGKLSEKSRRELLKLAQSLEKRTEEGEA
jgi:predicted transcriptional regulator